MVHRMICAARPTGGECQRKAYNLKNMKTTIKRQPTQTLQDFADAHGLSLEITEEATNPSLFKARLTSLQFSNGGVPVGIGSSPHDAINDLISTTSQNSAGMERWMEKIHWRSDENNHQSPA